MFGLSKGLSVLQFHAKRLHSGSNLEKKLVPVEVISFLSPVESRQDPERAHCADSLGRKAGNHKHKDPW